ncbi:NAD(P)-dependent dehydrogenase (short-subunit alcohol dehydrogenase family) [Bradyrhizobium sp. LB1.3]
MPDIDRAYLVTGAASGIGRATAKLLAAPGNALLLHTRSNAAGLDATAAEAEAQGAIVAKCLGDLAEETAATDAIAAAQVAFGRLDGLILVGGQCPPRQRDRHAGGSVPPGDGRIGAGVHAPGRRRAPAVAGGTRCADRRGVVVRGACDPA